MSRTSKHNNATPKSWKARTAAALMILTVVGYVAFRPNVPQPPTINTASLDSAVADLIQTTLQEVRDSPRSSEAWGKLGSVLMHYEFVTETRNAFTRAENLAPKEPRWAYLHALAIRTKDSSAAIEKLRRATASSEAGPDPPRLRLAQALAEQGLNEEAETHFELLLQFTPGHPPAQLGLARLRQSQGRLAEATNLLAGCLHNPHTAKNAHAALAMVEQALGNASAAEAAAGTSSILPADVPWPDPWWKEALKWRVGRRALLDDAVALIEQQSWPDAMKTLDQMTRDDPQDHEAWYLMGWALNQQQRSREAEKALREHLLHSPQSPKGHAQLAVSLLNQRRFADAVEVLQTGLKLKPTWRELHSNLGYACVQLGRDDEAITHFRNALDLDPNYVPTYTALAELLNRRGDEMEARTLLFRALELSPSDDKVKSMLDRLGTGR